MEEKITWKFVKDELPKKDGGVLVTMQDGQVMELGYWKDKKKFIDWHTDMTEFVIAWAYLPKGVMNESVRNQSDVSQS